MSPSHSFSQFLYGSHSIVPKAILVLKTTNLKLTGDAYINSKLFLFPSGRQLWKHPVIWVAIKEKYSCKCSITRMFLHSHYSIMFCVQVILTFYSATLMTQSVFPFLLCSRTIRGESSIHMHSSKLWVTCCASGMEPRPQSACLTSGLPCWAWSLGPPAMPCSSAMPQL